MSATFPRINFDHLPAMPASGNWDEFVQWANTLPEVVTLRDSEGNCAIDASRFSISPDPDAMQQSATD